MYSLLMSESIEDTVTEGPGSLSLVARASPRSLQPSELRGWMGKDWEHCTEGPACSYSFGPDSVPPNCKADWEMQSSYGPKKSREHGYAGALSSLCLRNQYFQCTLYLILSPLKISWRTYNPLISEHCGVCWEPLFCSHPQYPGNTFSDLH